MDIRILLADPCGLLREGLGLIISSEPGMQVVAMAADGHAALVAARKKRSR